MDANRLVRDYKDVVFTICLQVLRHRQDAEDACQEVLLKMARMPDGADPAPWIHRVALRTAIDHRRARLRRKAREERSARPERVADEAAPAILEALETLSDEDRTVLVEHFFGRKTLRAMADARGVTEPAVWKRVEKGKERLRQALLATAPALAAVMDGVLDAVEPATAPGRVLPVATAKTAVLLAALALPTVVVAGLAARDRAPEAPVRPSESRPAAAVVAPPAASPSRPAAPMQSAPASAHASVPPYPWELPPRHWPAVRRTAWTCLNERRFDVDATDALMHEILDDLARRSGVAILLDPAVEVPSKRVTFKVKDLLLKNILKLLVAQLGVNADLRSDGVVWVTSPERQGPDPDEVYAAAESARNGLEKARRELAAGREGFPGGDDAARAALESETPIDIAPSEYSLSELLGRLREGFQVNLHIAGIDATAPDPELAQRHTELIRHLQEARSSNPADPEVARLDNLLRQLMREMWKDPAVKRPYGGGRKSLRGHLVDLGHTWEFGFAPSDGILLICPREDAARAQAASDAQHAERVWTAARLEQAVVDPPKTVAALSEAFPRSTGLRLVCDEASWAATVPPAPTWHALLDGLVSQGLRWVYADGAVYVTR